MDRVEQDKIVEFVVIENPVPNYLDKYDEFVKDYNNPNKTIDQIKDDIGLNQHQYLKMRKQAISNNDISGDRRVFYNNSKHYTRNANGGYVIKKVIDGKLRYVGTFEDESTTQTIVQECINQDWNLHEVKDLIEENRKKPKHYSYINGYYVVQKCINGKNEYFCRFKDEETAIRVVEKLEEFNWDKNSLSIIFKELCLN